MDPQTKTRQQLAYNVRRIRELKRMTQRQVAESMESVNSMIWSIEHAHQNVSLDTLSKLADALGVEVAELFAPVSEE